MSDEVPSEDGYTHATIENEENSQDDRMYQAVDNFMGCQEQTYEEFLAGFTYLTKEDLVKQHAKMTSKPEETSVPWESRSSQSHPTDIGTEDDIEEEVLDEGTCVSTMSKLPGSSAGSSMVKVDNFVDCEDKNDNDDDDDDDDDDINELLGDGGYAASFGVTPGGTTHDQEKITLVDQDLQVSSVHDNETETENIVNVGNKEPQIEEDSTVEEQSNVDDFINPGEVDSVKTIPELASLKNQTRLDCKTTVSDVQKSSSGSSELRDSVVPGTIEGTDTQGNSGEVCLDEIESFSLDPTFDYDNVTLTPKYSDADLRIIMRNVNTS